MLRIRQRLIEVYNADRHFFILVVARFLLWSKIDCVYIRVTRRLPQSNGVAYPAQTPTRLTISVSCLLATLIYRNSDEKV